MWSRLGLLFQMGAICSIRLWLSQLGCLITHMWLVVRLTNAHAQPGEKRRSDFRAGTGGTLSGHHLAVCRHSLLYIEAMEPVGIWSGLVMLNIE